jgi:hypothetical protein
MKIIYLILFLLVCIPTFAQKDKKTADKLKPTTPNELDATYSPPANSIFDENSPKNEGYSSLAPFKNVIKFNPFLLTRSTFALGYERSIFKGITGSVFLGYNYKRDLIQAIGILGNVNSEIPSKDMQSIISLPEMIVEGAFKSGGLFTSIGLRYYIEETAFDGYYLEVQTRFNNYSLDMVNSENSSNYNFDASAKSDVSIQNITTNLIWGDQIYNGKKRSITHEYYVGVGLRNTSYNIIDVKDINDGNGNTISSYSVSDKRENVLGLSVVFGYIIGLGF